MNSGAQRSWIIALRRTKGTHNENQSITLKTETFERERVNKRFHLREAQHGSMNQFLQCCLFPFRGRSILSRTHTSWKTCNFCILICSSNNSNRGSNQGASLAASCVLLVPVLPVPTMLRIGHMCEIIRSCNPHTQAGFFYFRSCVFHSTRLSSITK